MVGCYGWIKQSHGLKEKAAHQCLLAQQWIPLHLLSGSNGLNRLRLGWVLSWILWALRHYGIFTRMGTNDVLGSFSDPLLDMHIPCHFVMFPVRMLLHCSAVKTRTEERKLCEKYNVYAFMRFFFYQGVDAWCPWQVLANIKPFTCSTSAPLTVNRGVGGEPKPLVLYILQRPGPRSTINITRASYCSWQIDCAPSQQNATHKTVAGWGEMESVFT